MSLLLCYVLSCERKGFLIGRFLIEGFNKIFKWFGVP